MNGNPNGGSPTSADRRTDTRPTYGQRLRNATAEGMQIGGKFTILFVLFLVATTTVEHFSGGRQ